MIYLDKEKHSEWFETNNYPDQMVQLGEHGQTNILTIKYPEKYDLIDNSVNFGSQFITL